MAFDLPGYDELAGGRGLGIDLEGDYGFDRYGSLGGSGSGGLYDEEIPFAGDGLLDLYVPFFPCSLFSPCFLVKGCSPSRICFLIALVSYSGSSCGLFRRSLIIAALLRRKDRVKDGMERPRERDIVHLAQTTKSKEM
jgi:hypothetical protein